MIFDAKVEVLCDNPQGCNTSVYIDLPAGPRNTYLANDSYIESQLTQSGWTVKDGKHYCCEECHI